MDQKFKQCTLPVSRNDIALDCMVEHTVLPQAKSSGYMLECLDNKARGLKTRRIDVTCTPRTANPTTLSNTATLYS